jgi:hypothetical protein
MRGGQNGDQVPVSRVGLAPIVRDACPALDADGRPKIDTTALARRQERLVH